MLKSIWNENLKHLKSLGKYIRYILEHMVCIIAILIFFAISCKLLSKAQIINPSAYESQEILIFGISLNNWGTWITGIGLIITAICSMYQYHKSVLRRQQEKASQIAKQFSDHLLLKYEIVNIVYKNSPFKVLLGLEHLDYGLFHNFNIDEVRKTYKDYNFPTLYQKMKKSIRFDDLYYHILEKRITVKEIAKPVKIKRKKSLLLNIILR